MLRFRIFVISDPEADSRGYSFAGIKVPLTTFAPVSAHPSMQDLDGNGSYGRYTEYWKLPTRDVIQVRPDLARHLKGLDFILIPTEWADVAPVDSFRDM